jgi:hypothetical protein
VLADVQLIDTLDQIENEFVAKLKAEMHGVLKQEFSSMYEQVVNQRELDLTSPIVEKLRAASAVLKSVGDCEDFYVKAVGEVEKMEAVLKREAEERERKRQDDAKALEVERERHRQREQQLERELADERRRDRGNGCSVM